MGIGMGRTGGRNKQRFRTIDRRRKERAPEAYTRQKEAVKKGRRRARYVRRAERTGRHGAVRGRAAELAVAVFRNSRC
jgi:hypothetical protein